MFQLDQKTEQLRNTQLVLEEKRTDLIKTQSGLQEMEEKYYSSTASIQDAAVADLRVGRLVTAIKEIMLKLLF